MLRRVVLIITAVSEDLSASIISGKNMLNAYAFLRSARRLLVKANFPSSPILVTLMMEDISSSETSVLTKATRRNISKYGILHSNRHEKLKSFADFP
jgi:hypothetical protein